MLTLRALKQATNLWAQRYALLMKFYLFYTWELHLDLLGWAQWWQTYLMNHIIPNPTPQVYSPQGCQWLGGEIILQVRDLETKSSLVTFAICGKTSQNENIMLPRQMHIYRLNNQCLFGRFYPAIIAIITRGLERCFCFNLHKPWKSKHHVLSVGGSGFNTFGGAKSDFQGKVI